VYSKVIVDCDAGIDDALAILFALASREVDCKAITTVSGNVDVFQSTENVLKILELTNLNELPPVARGSKYPLSGTVMEARSTHGKDGLGNTFLPPPKIKAASFNAINLIIEILNRENNVILVAIGPLTNIAKVIDMIEHKKEARNSIKEIIIMGGVLNLSGGLRELKEFNISSDIDAASRVFASPIEKRLVSLDITSQVFLEKIHIDHFKKFKSRLAAFIVDILSFAFNYNRIFRKIEGIFIHDAVVLGIAMDNNLGRFKGLNLKVDTEFERGRILEIKGKPNMQVCIGFERKKFLELFIDRLDFIIDKGRN